MQMKRPGTDYAHARSSVTSMYQAGVPILAGKDANTQPGVPTQVPHGESLHHELELLVDAGLSTVGALRATMSLQPSTNDRGSIEPGQRVDLVLLLEDPIKDIRATRYIKHAWYDGIQC